MTVPVFVQRFPISHKLCIFHITAEYDHFPRHTMHFYIYEYIFPTFPGSYWLQFMKTEIALKTLSYWCIYVLLFSNPNIQDLSVIYLTLFQSQAMLLE